MGFYPNTRTFISIFVGGYVSHDKGTYYTGSMEFESKNDTYNLNTGLEFYYYISPKLRLGGKAGYEFHHLKGTHSIDNKYNNYNYNDFRSQFGWDMLIGDNDLKPGNLFFELSFTYSIF